MRPRVPVTEVRELGSQGQPGVVFTSLALGPSAACREVKATCHTGETVRKSDTFLFKNLN